MQYEIKELGVGGILDQAIRLSRANLRAVLAAVLVCFIPAAVISVIQTHNLLPIRGMEPGAITPEMASELIFKNIPLQLLFMVVLGISFALCNAALAWGIAQHYLGHEMDIKDAFRRAIHRIGGLMLAGFLSILAVAGGMVLFVIPGIYLMFALYIVGPCLMLENLPALAAMRRSRQLMKGHMMKAFVLVFLLGIIQAAVGAVVNLVPNPYVAAIFNQVAAAVLMIFGVAVDVVIYFSARCKVENFDLELLAQLVEGPSESTPSTL